MGASSCPTGYILVYAVEPAGVDEFEKRCSVTITRLIAAIAESAFIYRKRNRCAASCRLVRTLVYNLGSQ